MRLSVSLDTYIQKTKKLYIDSRARRNLGSINTELQDVQRIMVANIEEVLQRGEALSGESLPPVQTDGSSFEDRLLFLILSSSFFFSPFSPWCSARLQGQQLIQPVQKVQERRQIPEHPLHLRQAGSRWRLFHHAYRLRALLVALRGEAEEEERGSEEELHIHIY